MSQMADPAKDVNGTDRISIQEISLPKGGGAIRGIGDSFQPDFFSGTGNYSIPIPVTPARGFEPQLALNYNSGSGNSEFGLGFSLSLPKISTGTNKRIPQYEGNDTYVLAGTGELVKEPGNKAVINPRKEIETEETFTVTSYLPRIESTFSKIEQWVSDKSGISFWKIVSKDNTTSYYGQSGNSRVSNPDNDKQVFEWLIDKSYDSKGNKILYTYKAEDNDNVPHTIYEVNRSGTANRYIQDIQYGNYSDAQGNEQFAFEIKFDYGEYGQINPGAVYVPTGNWTCRTDPFSSYRSGFEIRTYRLCRNILLFHSFPNELGDPCLVRSMTLSYSHIQEYKPLQIEGMSLLVMVNETGYRKNVDRSISQQQTPPLGLTYSSFHPPQSPEFKILSMGNGTIPGYIDGSQFIPVDLLGDGLPGFLYSNQAITLYLEPEGNGNYLLPGNLDLFPVNKGLGEGASLADIDGNGQLEVVVNTAGKAGYYQSKEEGGWDNFRPFVSYPVGIPLPEVEMADLDGNGKTDMLLADTEDISIYFSEGKKGYSPGKSVLNENGFPLKKQDYLQELVTFADMFGDGLSHRVRIRSGSVECWPCLGYGRYGKKITFSGAPVFDDDFDSTRIFLADIDGSGTSDIIYAYPNRIEVFLNQSGNSFSDPVKVVLPDIYGKADRISFSDILGTGTACLVFTRIAPVPVHYYYNFVGEVILRDGNKPAMKPYLLCEIDNNIGSITEIQYCSSTKFALEDKLRGRPWVTKLRFPVQVVEETVLLDRLSRSRYVTRFKYHDGYYDPVEREFRGFGFVELWDSETFEQFRQSRLHAPFPVGSINQELFVPPVHTKIWYHTGAFKEYQSILAQYRSEYFHDDINALEFPESVFANEVYTGNEETFRQAYVALKGNIIRKEVYAEDGSKDSPNPFTVEESNYEIVVKCAARKDAYAVFAVNPRESISYSYDRDPADPMIRQRFVLETDPWCGEARKSCDVFLPRRNVSGPGIHVYPEQRTPKITAAVNLYYNTTVSPDTQLRGILYDAQEFEILGGGLDTGSSYFSYHEIKEQVLSALQHIIPYQGTNASGLLQAQQLSWTQSYFWNEDQSDVLPLGQVSSRALLHHRRAAVFTRQNITDVFGDKLTDEIIQDQGGYFFDAVTRYWQNKGLVQYYFTTPDCFYMPCKTENSFADPSSSLFRKTTVGYDPYYLIPVSTSQYLDESTVNVISACIDYNVMKPMQLIDINNNVSQVIYDSLGQVMVSSIFGTENGGPTGGMRLYEYLGQPAEYIVRNTSSGGTPIKFIDVLNNPEYYLQGAASYFFYDLNAYTTGGTDPQPVNSINLIRENYYHLSGGISTFSYQALIAYNDGSGRSIEKKQRVDPGMAFIRDTEGKLLYENNTVKQALVEQRWLVSGRTVYNNKGKVCEEYFPYFSNTPCYETQEEIVSEQLVPPPTVTHYDPLLRVIRIDTPKGFFSKVAFTPWEVKQFDENDTVKDSIYYITFMANYPSQPTQEQKDEKDALDKAAVFYDTPAINVFNNTGNTFLDIKSLPDRLLTGYQESDIQGRVLKIIDARLYKSNLDFWTAYYNFKYVYAMGDKRPWFTDSADAGCSKFFNNIFGNSIQIWNADNYNVSTRYDRLQRLLQSAVKTGDGIGDFMAERIVYGESLPSDGKNLRGQVYERYDQSGISRFQSYSLQGMPLCVKRKLTVDYKNPVDWKDPSKVPVETDEYVLTNTYDALKRLLTETTPDGTVTVNTYSQAGLLNTVSLIYQDGTQQAVVNSIDYNANTQRILIRYQNGVKTSYAYEDLTQRLINLYSTRTGTDKPVLQNIRYVYDPVGNITRSRDSSFEVVFCSNQQVEPLSDCTYNAVYQLLQATGRQHQGINKDTHINGFKQSIYGDICPPNLNDETKLEQYTENYIYDDGGNLVSKQHIAVSSSWTEETAVPDNCNRLKGMPYDAAGNMLALQLNNSVPLTWDYRNNLISAGIIQRTGEDDDRDYYNYDGEGNRLRKVSERLTSGGSLLQVEVKIYLGNYEIKLIKTVSAAGENVILNRQCLRVFDNTACIAAMYYWVTDYKKREVIAPGLRSLRYQLGNNVGSIAMEVDDGAQIISYEEYFPFGGTSIIAGKNRQEVAIKDYRYCDKECDDTTGLYYYGARYYVSWLGRWLSPDPSGPVDGLNLYAYVGGNPLTFTDPTGNGRVSAALLQKLISGHNAITVTRGHVPYSGNVTDDVNATHAESTARLSVARSILVNIFGDNEQMVGGNNAINRAASAIGAHGGACNEFSALTHTEIISHATVDPVIRVWDPVAHHSFTMIGDPRATPASEIVVADAWPSRYQVATLEHTRWDRDISVGHLTVDTITPPVSAAQALLNAADLATALALIPAVGNPNGRLLLYDVAGAQADTAGTAGTAGRDDPRGPRNIGGGETYGEYFTRTQGWAGLFPNDYSTNLTRPYDYYSSVVVRAVNAADGSILTTTTDTHVTGAPIVTHTIQRKRRRNR